MSISTYTGLLIIYNESGWSKYETPLGIRFMPNVKVGLWCCKCKFKLELEFWQSTAYVVAVKSVRARFVLQIRLDHTFCMTARRVVAGYIIFGRYHHRARLLDAFPGTAIQVWDRLDRSNEYDIYLLFPHLSHGSKHKMEAGKYKKSWSWQYH